MKYCFSMETVDLNNQAPNRNKRESRYFWDELNCLISAGGFRWLEMPYEPKWDFGGRSGIPRTKRSIDIKFGDASKYLADLKEKGIDGIGCIHFNPSLFCRDVVPMYFGAFGHFAEEALGFAKEAECDTVSVSVTPPVFAVDQLLKGESEEGFLSETQKLISGLSEKAEKEGIALCLKNEFWSLLRGEKIIGFLKELPESVKLDIDTANLRIAGVDLKGFIRENKDRIGVVHFTDTSFEDTDETYRTALPEFPPRRATKVFTDMGEGSVDLKGVYETLREISYDGPLVFNPKDSYDISRSILRTAYFAKKMEVPA